ncbi:MAG TPA: hypothetical protein VGB82_13850 [Alphaproteobacteria bacterium]
MMPFDGEPSLEEALADPVVTAMMRADRVDPQSLKTTLMDLAQRLAGDAHPEHIDHTGDATMR